MNLAISEEYFNNLPSLVWLTENWSCTVFFLTGSEGLKRMKKSLLNDFVIIIMTAVQNYA